MKIVVVSVLVLLHLKCISAETHLLSSVCHVEKALPSVKLIVEEERSINTFCQEYYPTNKQPLGKKSSSCADLFNIGFRTSSVYMVSSKVSTKRNEIQVYCDMETEGGGWTVFQRRGQFPDPQINFTRSWTDYEKGFGNLFQEFWLGNENIYDLSSRENMTLRFDLEDFSGNRRYAKYQSFNISSADDFYKLFVKDFSGNAGDSFTTHNGQKFVTFDMNDVNNCSASFKGGWWYAKCHRANLNGLNLKGKHESYANGIDWYDWLGHHYSLKHTEMKMRPQTFI